MIVPAFLYPMKKLALILALATLGTSNTVFAAAGIFGTAIGLESNLFNSGDNTFFEADLLNDPRFAPTDQGFGSGNVTLPVVLNTSGFNGLNLGAFNPTAGDTLTLIGGELLTFKNNSSDITGAFINYSIDGGAFVPVSIPFNEDNINATTGDQRWASTTNAINVLTGLGNGAHTLSFFASAPTNGVNADPQIFDSNSGNNFTASFSVVPEPGSFALALLGSVGLLTLRRQRR